ncbi:MAG: hypothetical protein Kow00128_12280 [Deltaproteobacteria bacterium]
MRMRALSGCILLSSILAVGLWSDLAPAAPGDLYYTEGRQQLVEGKRRDAEASFRKALRENPDHVEALYQLALIHTGNVLTYGQAEKELLDLPAIATRVGGSGRDDLLFRSGVALGKLYLRSGRPRLCIQLVRNVIASAPAGSALDDAYNTLGLALYYDRSYEDAIFELRKAIKFNPDNREARFNLKTIRARLEHYQAGKIYDRMGEPGEAIDQFRQAIHLDPRFVEARHRLGAALLARGDFEEALRELRRADSISSDYRKAYEIWYAEGQAMERLGMPDDALRMYRNAAEARPNFAAAHNAAGKILLDRGEYEEAIRCFVRAIGIDPRTEYVRNLQIAFTKKGP